MFGNENGRGIKLFFHVISEVIVIFICWVLIHEFFGQNIPFDMKFALVWMSLPKITLSISFLFTIPHSIYFSSLSTSNFPLQFSHSQFILSLSTHSPHIPQHHMQFGRR